MFTTLLDRLAVDPFTYGITQGELAKLSTILGELMADGDVIQHIDGSFEATEDGWEKVTHFHANEALGGP